MATPSQNTVLKTMWSHQQGRTSEHYLSDVLLMLEAVKRLMQ